MKYYIIRYAKKSHCDYPSPMLEDVFSARDDTEKERKVESFTKGCEDWDVREISKEVYDHYYDDQRYL